MSAFKALLVFFSDIIVIFVDLSNDRLIGELVSFFACDLGGVPTSTHRCSPHQHQKNICTDLILKIYLLSRL